MSARCLPHDETPAALVAIGLSAGGLQPLLRIVRDIPADFPGAIVIAQHASAMSRLDDLIRARARLPVRSVCDGDDLRSAHLYLCPPGRHVVATPEAKLSISACGRVRFFHPSVDWLFESAAASFGERAIGVVLSGRFDDGARGSRRLAAGGGVVIAQDPSSCVEASMPTAAIRTGAVSRVLKAGDIAAALCELVGRPECAAARRQWLQPFGAFDPADRSLSPS